MNLAVFYGGDSTERDIATISGVQALNQLDDRFHLYPIFVRDGKWYMPKHSADMNTYRNFRPDKHPQVVLIGNKLYRLRGKRLKWITQIDCALICMHGGFGENGGLQGLLDGNGVPYTSPDVTVSALGMDKRLSKTYFENIGCRVTEWVALHSDESDREKLDTFVARCGYPLIVKPNAQGSSIGIEVAHDAIGLADAIHTAFAYDNCVIVERALQNFKEINCACVATRNGVIVSSLEQPVGWKEFLSFETKYLTDGKMSGGGRLFPAPLDSETTEQIRQLSERVYRSLDMQGVVRFDYMIDEKNKVYLNEMNTVPGSLAYYLFADKHIGYSELVDMMCRYSMERASTCKHCAYVSEVLSRYNPARGGKMGCKA